MKRIIEVLALISVFSLAIPSLAMEVDQKVIQGTALYEKHCASCHEVAATSAPTRASLAQMSAAVIMQEMSTGKMKLQAQALNKNQSPCCPTHTKFKRANSFD